MQNHQQRLFQQFEKELHKLCGNALIVEETEVSEKLQAIFSEGTENVVVYRSTLLEKILPERLFPKENRSSVQWLPATRPPDFDYEKYRQMMIEADTGIIASDYLMADSGSIVLLEKHHRSQMVTLLPSTLIVLATAHQIVENIHSLHKTLQKNNQPETSIHYIAGPSRTADIEKNLILGVHGPGELYVLVVQ